VVKKENYIYLDNAASYRTDPEIAEAFRSYAVECFANPEGWNSLSYETSERIKNASLEISEILTGVDMLKTFWTDSATTGINVVSEYLRKKKKRILIAGNEHPAIRSAFSECAETVKVTDKGCMDLNHLRSLISEDVCAVVVHHVQNETGIIENLSGVREVINEVSSDILLMADTVQSLGKIDIPWDKAVVNIAFGAGHKIGAPSGGAVFYRMNDSELRKFELYLKELREKYYKVSRPDPAVVFAFTDAVVKMCENQKRNYDKVRELNCYAREKLLSEIKGIRFLGDTSICSPYILTFLIRGIQAEVLVRILSSYGIMISAGSACSASSNKPSPAVTAMGISGEDARSVFRVSFSTFSEIREVDTLVSGLKKALKEY